LLPKLQAYGHLRDINADSGRVTAVISTGDVARDDAIIDPDGWDFANYDRNPVVLWMHDDRGVPFARTVERGASGDNLVATAEFDLEDPQGAAMFRKVTRGYINAASVRWLPKRWEYRKMGTGDQSREVLVFLEQELLEWSFVTIPADPKALIVRADGQPLDMYAFRSPEPKPDDTISSPPAAAVSGAGAVDTPSPVLAAYRDEDIQRAVARFLLQRHRQQESDAVVVRALATATGRDEARIRRELAGMEA
jgi:hypothetical protein